MALPEQADLEALLEDLVGAGIEFIVIDGTAAILHGAPTSTLDLDIVHRLDPGNLERLDRLLVALDATVRDFTGRRLVPDRSHLAAGGQLQLNTRKGPLDLIGKLHDGRGYDELLDHTVSVGDPKMRVTVLDLPTLIEIKRSTGRARDALILPLLIALLDERGDL